MYLFSPIINLLFGPSESQNIRKQKKNVKLFMYNQQMQQSIIKSKFHKQHY